jgi:hypothetical protein
MSSCYIFNKSLLESVNYSQATINTAALSALIPAFDSSTSGLWLPIIISSSTLSDVDFLIQPKSNPSQASFDPTNCTDASSYDYDTLQLDASFNCSYCNNFLTPDYKATWNLTDADGASKGPFTSDCSSGACDTRMRKDDYLQKIPILNQNYLNKFFDFKYLKQFPAASNPGLGFGSFITFPQNSLTSIFSQSPQLIIDWRIKETIDEIPYDLSTSQYNLQYDHDKAYNKAKYLSQTCGNFIHRSSLNGSESNINKLLPDVDNFITPYGFDKDTYHNIFIKTKKVASYWKWNYNSGVLCWYRYFDTNKTPDTRPIKGVDLYISPGDVFYATNDGPEPNNTITEFDSASNAIKPCPSGLKIIKASGVAEIIPSGSAFTYISANIYSKFRSIYYRINKAVSADGSSQTVQQKFDLAALLATAPEYDEITVDLTKRNASYSYIINNYFQISGLNIDMLSGTEYGSVGKLNYIKNSGDLINTLANKYGAYLWCPHNTTSTIQLSNNINHQCLIDLDFDVVASISDVKMRSNTCTPTTDCTANTLEKNFSYSQKFVVGNVTFESRLNTGTQYKAVCKNNAMVKTNSIQTAGLLLNSSTIKEVPYNSGCYTFSDNYPRILVNGQTPANSCCNNYNDSDNYPCNFCDPDSTYYLPNVKANKICTEYTGNDSWCDQRSAFGDRPARNIQNNTLYYKRSYPATAFNPHLDYVAFHHQGGVFFKNSLFGDNISGTTAFGSNSLFDDTNGGICKLEFTTSNVGIKIYSLKIEKLRGSSSDSAGCRAFPISNKCKCFNMLKVTDFPYRCGSSQITYGAGSIYTPNLSTQFSPPVKAYGGYSLNDINKLLGGGEISSQIAALKKEINNLSETIKFMELAGLSIDKDGTTLESYKNDRTSKRSTLNGLTQALAEFRIPGHPEPENILSSASKYIDPIYPYGKSKSVTATLNNYVTTYYNITLPSYNTVHSDIWAEIIEDIDLFKPTILNEYFEITGMIPIGNGEGIPITEGGASPNLGYQRFANEVIIDNTTLYSKQKKNIASKGNTFSNAVSISITNPYLEALASRYELYPPFGSFCQKNIFASRGDETSSVSIKFYKIPRKQILNFYIKKPKSLGVLKKGFFHPNKGLTSDSSYTDKTPIIQYDTYNYIIDYDKDNFSPSAQYSTSGIVLYGEMNDTIRRTISQINDFDNHRKLRLYLFINNGWYEYSIPNIGGFYNNNNLSIGPPFVFEYLNNEKDTTAIGPWLPAVPKKNIDFNFIYNYPIKNIDDPNLIFINNKYLLKISKNTNNAKQIILEGVRPYFYIAEKDSATTIASSTIENMTSDEQESITYSNPEIKLGDGLRYRYIDGPKNQASSYIFSDYNYLYTNFSDLHIDYTSANQLGYVYNTKKLCNQEIEIIDASKPNKQYVGKIIEKNIYAYVVDRYGNRITSSSSSKDQYIKIYTELVLENNLRYDTAYLDFNRLYQNDQSADGMDSFLVFKDLKSSLGLKKETDHILYNPIIETKWGDLIGFDDRKQINEITSYIYNNNYLNQFYPSATYLNHFYKTIINNANYSNHNFLLKTSSGNINLSTTGLVYYTIHQKYNVDYYKDLARYDYLPINNYLPFIDINILPNPGESSNTIRSTINSSFNFSNNKLWSGIINISGIYTNLESNHDWAGYLSPRANQKEYFWINLDSQNKLKSSLTLQSSVGGFYSNTLRINDTPIQLTSITHSVGTLPTPPIDGCRQMFRVGGITLGDITIPNNSVFDFSHFTSSSTGGGTFARYPVYCDSDTLTGCDSKTCGISTVGWDSFSSTYTAYTPKQLSISDIAKKNDIPYILSYDGGFYNPIGNSGVNYIQRFELNPDSTLFQESLCNSTNIPRPNDAKVSVLNEEYQSMLSSSIVTDHTALVNNTDTLANEMLFRLIYGEQQKINLERIDNLSDYIKNKDLYKYIEPEIEAKDIYKNIPYDLDNTADCSDRKINGSISIDGILALNKQVDVTIGNVDMQFKIEKDNNGTVNIRLYCSSLSAGYIDSKIYEEKTTVTSLIVADGLVSGPGITQVATCTERGQFGLTLSKAITSATVTNTLDCSKPPQETATAEFPIKLSDYACSGTHYPGDPTRGCICERGLPIYYSSHQACSDRNDFSYDYPVNRGVGTPVAVGTEFTSTETTIMVGDGDKSRGVFNRCFNGSTSLLNCGVNTNLGGIEDIPKTTAVKDYTPSFDSSSGDSDTSCHSIDDARFSPFGVFYPPNPGSTADACECKDYTYGYCRRGSCVGISTFSYSFEYCRHSITLMGYKKR